MQVASEMLMRIGALCALAAMIDVCVEGTHLRSGVRLVAALLLVLAMMEMGRSALDVLGWRA